MFNNDVDRLSYYYQKGWAKDAQLRMYVQFEVITPEQYTEITGNEYVLS
ncbi:XkdX family protein [Paenibacillus aquistagni]|nr:XkdX family protein [Paenibacillus aquistagni]NMM53538.1 XkdX family protein [Paenibacillus aquistagni]